MDTKFKNVSETLLITLNARGKDADSPNSVLNDKKSAEIMSRIDYDFSKFDKGWMSYYGILARAKTMDQEIKKFMDKYPDCVVVSIGAGLDTRFSRIDNGKITWYNLDLPEVIDKRIAIYQKEIYPVLSHFADRGVKITHIDGVGTVGQVHDRIVEELEACKII